MREVTVLPRRKFPIETILWSMEFDHQTIINDTGKQDSELCLKMQNQESKKVEIFSNS